MTVNINYIKLTPTAQAPTRGSKQAAGWDLHADLDGRDYVKIFPHTCKRIPTGLKIALPEGTFGAIYARSGLATNKGLAPVNKGGVVDSDYRGEVVVALYNSSNEIQTIEQGERIAQLIVQPYYNVIFNETDELSSTERNEGGFGSSGNK